MNKFVKGAIALFAVSAIVVGCKKYEEGPSLSLRSKKARLAGDWEVEAYFHNGADQTSNYLSGVTSNTYTVEKDGNFNTEVVTSLGTWTTSGTWEFINDKVDLKTTTTTVNGTALSSPSLDTTTIIRLTNKEFWTKDVSGSDTDILHYKSK